MRRRISVYLNAAKCNLCARMRIVIKMPRFGPTRVSKRFNKVTGDFAEHYIGGCQMSRTATHKQISCSFSSKSKHEVRTLIEGGCRNPALSQCVFICDECVAFSPQVIADLERNAKEPQIS